MAQISPGRPVDSSPRKYGIVFRGTQAELVAIRADMLEFFRELDFPLSEVSILAAENGRALQFGLNTPPDDTSTLDLKSRKNLAIKDESRTVTDKEGRKETIEIPSRKEILAALMQRGRVFELREAAGAVNALKEHIGVRQNIAFWGKKTRYVPFGTQSAFDSDAGWQEDWVVKPGVAPSDAVADIFLGPPGRYSTACTRVCKMIVVQGIMDYYANVAKNKEVLEHLNRLSDQRPLTEIHPRYEGEKIVHEGKFLEDQSEVASENWIPGDWGWLYNPDPVSSEHPGQEGKNTVYVGGGKFANLYDGGSQGPTLRDNLRAVYQWRPYSSQEPITEALMKQLLKDRDQGGLMTSDRSVPKLLKVK